MEKIKTFIEESSMTNEQIFLKIPKAHFDFKLNKTRFFEMVEFIRNEDLKGFNLFLSKSHFEWRTLGIYVGCLLKKKRFLFEMKDEMEDFSIHLDFSCLGTLSW